MVARLYETAEHDASLDGLFCVLPVLIRRRSWPKPNKRSVAFAAAAIQSRRKPWQSCVKDVWSS